MRHPFLVGTKVYLRGIEEADLLGNYFQWFNDEEVCRYNSHHRFPNSIEKARSYYQSICNGSRDLVLAVVAIDQHVHIGNISLQKIDYLNRSAEFAILMGERDYWGKGFAREAAELIVSHGFSELNLHRIYCGTDAKNDGMQRLAEALGMKQEGVRREATFKQGEYRDMIEYGILAPEFYARTSTKGRESNND